MTTSSREGGDRLLFYKPVLSMNHLVKDTPYLSTIYFKSYEEREEAFRESVFSIIPRKYSGPRLFWRDFGQVSIDELLEFSKHPLAYVTSNPRDGLAFGTPWQVLRAALLSTRKAGHEIARPVETIAEEFDLLDQLKQPIRTLSGGETVKLALAKAAIAADTSRKLIIASPFSWLSRENRLFFQRLFDYYAQSDIPVELYALEGEDSEASIDRAEFNRGMADERVDFRLRLSNLRISLGSGLNPIYSQQTEVRVADFEAALRSPALIVGGNGRGKSLIAKALAGAVSFMGQAELTADGRTGPARLLFQDVVSQTLLRSFDAIAASSGNNGLRPLEWYEAILKAYGDYLPRTGEPTQARVFSGPAGFRSLLDIKAILIAARLCIHPSALILDEPDWGLTQASAIALVAAVIRVAHAAQIPVILISHKSWWPTIANSIIRVDRSPKRITDKGQSFFDISLSEEKK